MNVGTTHYRSIWPIGDDAVGIIDQTTLPHSFATRTVTGSDDMIAAIKTMAVRGAPLIGVAGAYGLALAMRDNPSDAHLAVAYQRLSAARPTASRPKKAQPASNSPASNAATSRKRFKRSVAVQKVRSATAVIPGRAKHEPGI